MKLSTITTKRVKKAAELLQFSGGFFNGGLIYTFVFYILYTLKIVSGLTAAYFYHNLTSYIS